MRIDMFWINNNKNNDTRETRMNEWLSVWKICKFYFVSQRLDLSVCITIVIIIIIFCDSVVVANGSEECCARDRGCGYCIPCVFVSFIYISNWLIFVSYEMKCKMEWHHSSNSHIRIRVFLFHFFSSLFRRFFFFRTAFGLQMVRIDIAVNIVYCLFIWAGGGCKAIKLLLFVWY